MILSALFVTFLSVLGTFCDDLPHDEGFPGASSHESATSRRIRHRKHHERLSRSPARHGKGHIGHHPLSHQPGDGNDTTAALDLPLTAPANSSDNSTAPLDSQPVTSVNSSGNSTAPLPSQTSTSVNSSGNSTAPLASQIVDAVNSSLNSTAPLASSIGKPLNLLAASLPATSGGSAVFGLNADHLQHDGIYLGFIPDAGDEGGNRQTMSQINSALGKTSAAYGWYGQAVSGTLFDGSQLLSVLEDVKASKAVFQPAVMPVQGWKGLTSSDNSQAVAIANVMKKFTDQGIPVWLRFAHEMNYYQTDGTYVGTAADFKAGWAAVSAACKSIAPDVKMWWSPNVASADSYAAYAPDDMSTVDLVGIDFYPKTLSTGTEFVDTMKAFHDKYAVDGRKFAIGETGLGFAGTPADRFSWLSQVTSASAVLKNYVASSWFNYHKGYDFQIVSAQTPSLTSDFKNFLAA